MEKNQIIQLDKISGAHVLFKRREACKIAYKYRKNSTKLSMQQSHNNFLTLRQAIIYASRVFPGGKVGDVAQLGERGVRNAEARGSNPLISTRK
jgi:hypothetical protein